MFEFLKRAPFVEELIRRNPLFYAQFRQLLDEAETLSEGDRRAMRERLLARSVSHAIRLSGYRDAAGAIAFDALPILTKEILQARTPEFHSHQWPGISASTGGSTGRPLRLLRSARSIVVEQATIDWLAAKAGVALDRCRVAILRGNNIKDPNDQDPPYWRRDGSRRLVLSSNHLGPAHYQDFVAALEDFRPDVIHAYPSSLQLLTDLAEEHGTKLRFPLAITSSETLQPGLRGRVRTVFGAALAVIAALYFRSRVSHVLLFWAAFILTRPLGATVGDFFDKPVAQGGLNISRPLATAILAAIILVLIVALPQRAGEHPKSAAA